MEGLNKHPVKNYSEIDKKIEEGSNNRSIAATLMNESSSRSHTIVSISFVQKTQIPPAYTIPKSGKRASNTAPFTWWIWPAASPWARLASTPRTG